MKKLDLTEEERKERRYQIGLKWRSNPLNKEKERARSAVRRASEDHMEYRKVYMKEYNAKDTTRAKKAKYRSLDEVKAKRSEYNKEYRSRPDVIRSESDRISEYNKRPEVVERKKQRMREYNQRPEVVERTRVLKKAYVRRPEVKERSNVNYKKYASKPGVKEGKALRIKEKYTTNPEYRERVLDWARRFGGDHHRRVEKRGGYAERFPRTMIFERDKYVCSYCGVKLDLKTATLDHVVPVSKGGSHVPDNCTTSCKSCNSSKKDKLLHGVQISIFDRI